MLLLAATGMNYSTAQEADKTAAAITEPAIEEPSLQDKLLGTSESIKTKEQELKQLEQKIKTSKDQNFLKQAEQEVTEYKEIIMELKDEFIDLSTGGAKLYEEPKQPVQEFDWREDLKTIASPLVEQLKKITQHPRRIEELEANIAYWSSREAELKKAVDNLASTLSQVSNSKLKKDMQGLMKTAQSRHASAQQRLDLLNSDLKRLQIEGNPVWSNIGKTTRTIAISMGLHFMAALAAAVIAYYIIFLLGMIPLTLLGRKRHRQIVFLERLINLLRRMLGVLLAVFVFLMMLYGFSEWMILALSLVLMAAVLMGLRNAVPQYLVEFRTLLNIGSIRQNERLIYAGIPWRISRLDVYTHLHNPLLDGHLRVSLTDICHLTSRPYHDDEPWFPTKVGDVVILEDEVFGKVIRQTPDIVELEFRNSVFTYPTSLFLERRPHNLCRNGFTIFETFGVDYSHQPEIIRTILPVYKQELTDALATSPYQQNNNYLEVEFDKANTSSLDFKVIASFTGEAAENYYRIKRFIQKSSVDAANKHGWIIPFQQITVHSS